MYYESREAVISTSGMSPVMLSHYSVAVTGLIAAVPALTGPTDTCVLAIQITLQLTAVLPSSLKSICVQLMNCIGLPC